MLNTLVYKLAIDALCNNLNDPVLNVKITLLLSIYLLLISSFFQKMFRNAIVIFCYSNELSSQHSTCNCFCVKVFKITSK